MFELIITVAFCWLFFMVFKLMFNLAWGVPSSNRFAGLLISGAAAVLSTSTRCI